MDKYLYEGIKKSIEEDLSRIKKAKLDILILQRQNEELCQKNNEEIARLNEIIEDRLVEAEEYLKKSEERKIETHSGWVAFRAMPDSWEYDEPIILDWVKENELPYYHTVEILEKLKLKKDIQNNKFKFSVVGGDVPGIKVTPQAPKFNYKLNAGGELL